MMRIYLAMIAALLVLAVLAYFNLNYLPPPLAIVVFWLFCPHMNWVGGGCSDMTDAEVWLRIGMGVVLAAAIIGVAIWLCEGESK